MRWNGFVIFPFYQRQFFILFLTLYSQITSRLIKGIWDASFAKWLCYLTQHRCSHACTYVSCNISVYVSMCMCAKCGIVFNWHNVHTLSLCRAVGSHLDQYRNEPLIPTATSVSIFLLHIIQFHNTTNCIQLATDTNIYRLFILLQFIISQLA